MMELLGSDLMLSVLEDIFGTLGIIKHPYRAADFASCSISGVSQTRSYFPTVSGKLLS
jgi:hypothetical protein